MDNISKSFIHVPRESGILHQIKNTGNVTTVIGLLPGESFEPKPGCGYYLFQVLGISLFRYNNQSYPLQAHQTMSFSDHGLVYCEQGYGLIIETTNTNPIFTISTVIEQTGRLKYIDGCTDTLLIPPVKKGDPCFNHLHFPEWINQTMHTHPSVRIGVVARGRGECITPFGNMPLEAGMTFLILPGNGKVAKGLDGADYEEGSHCFKTFDCTMDVVAFHPDSDFGPQDEDHPMINRTIVDGVSAKFIDSIKTQ